MKKYLGVIIITSIATIGGVFANDFGNDCNIVQGSGIDNTVNAYGTKYIDVLPTTGFKQALINLKSYCCTRPNFMDCSDKSNVPTAYYPQSENLYSQLFDVAMRRLDGITWLAYNISPDPTALERRTKITAIANSATGIQAKTIEDMYTQYWTWHKYAEEYGNIDTIIKGYNKNIATVSLKDKYDTLCRLIRDIYSGAAKTQITVRDDIMLSNCTKKVTEREAREVGYIKILMVQKSNQLLDETTKAYTNTYFVQEKLMALWNLIVKVKDIFQTVVQQAPASKTCSK